jgi:IclR family transcriptional regulator, acetate operon repressor
LPRGTTSVAELDPSRAGDATPHHRELSGNRATARVLLILSQFSGDTASHGVSELSRELGMTKNMVHRALQTLARHGYLVRDASGTSYELGPGVLQFARVGLEPLNLPRLADPYMRRMQEASKETVSLAVRSGRTAVTIAGARGLGQIARRVPFGRAVALHASPASRAILAFLPDHEIDAYIADGVLERYTATTLTTAEQLHKEVRTVRERGYALSFGDHVRQGATGVAFPVPAADGTAHGSITVAGPSDRFTDERRAELLPALGAIMDELSRHSRLYPADLAVTGRII